MVKSPYLTLVLIVALTSVFFIGGVGAQRQYHFGQEWVKVWINSDGTIDLFYNISITLDSGDEIKWVSVGQPQEDFAIGVSQDQYGNSLQTEDVSSGSDYKVQISLHTSLKAGKTVWFTLVTNVANMLFEDETNPGNDGMRFTPTWWSETTVDDLRVSIVLPPNISESQVKTTSIFWSNTYLEDDRLTIYWEKQNLLPDEKLSVGVSYPKQEGWKSNSARPDELATFLQNYGVLLFVGGVAIVVLFVIFLVVRKRPYLKPAISIETLGIKRGLTAVEASYLLDMKPVKIVAEILYSLLKKRAIWVEESTPSLKLRILKPFLNKIGTDENPLRYYEIDFLNSLRKNGTLNEELLASTIMVLRDSVEEKLKGYCRHDTVEYYQKIVAKAWRQVEEAGTAGVASKVYDEQLLWLFLDPTLPKRTQTVFSNLVFEPSPLWLWYWYTYQYYTPNPTYRPNIDMSAKSLNPPTIPGGDFANNIATAIEESAGNFVTNVEKFVNSIVPSPHAQKSSKQPIHKKASCVCACAACACACACVSCACACAGGGIG